ncbi:MAG: metal ABC transporter substrate-binding protein [Oscillospiraceae bacterium]|jgi:zinc transport system substrate-binding protein|nr:metal ABC transporter substrate-binding protein [Oscillospiraceae bacterium]
MKRYAIIIALMLALLTTAACAAEGGVIESSEDIDKRISIVSTIFAPYDFAREIAGDRADIAMLLPPGSESHSFEPTPRDITTIQNCDVFIYVGGESDAWVDDVLDSMDTSNIRIITLMDCVTAVEEEIVEGMEEEGEEEAEESSEPEYDEHVWTSPRNAKLIVQKISDALCDADATNAAEYRQNTADYLAELDELDAGFQAVVDGAVRRTIVFGDRFPFRYFADAYNLDYFAAFPGCSTETEPSAATVKFLIDKINDEDIPVVFHIELSNERMANVISESTGAKALLLHAVHNITKQDFENGLGYIDLMTQNVERLKEALH